MTSQESFKRRVRERMAKTGERYTAARRVLLDQQTPDKAQPRRTWVSPPEMSDEATRQRTGRGHDEWIDIIESWDGDRTDHTEVVEFLVSNFDELDYWWAQSITVGYERITGLRLPYQRADGTFTASKSQTVDVDAGMLRKMLLDDDRDDLFGGRPTELRSKPTSKALRIGIGPADAFAIFTITDVGGGRSRVAIAHERLPNYDSVEEWKYFWSEWLEALG